MTSKQAKIPKKPEFQSQKLEKKTQPAEEIEDDEDEQQVCWVLAHYVLLVRKIKVQPVMRWKDLLRSMRKRMKRMTSLLLSLLLLLLLLLFLLLLQWITKCP